MSSVFETVSLRFFLSFDGELVVIWFFFVVLDDQVKLYDSLMNKEGIDVIMEDIFIGIEAMKAKGNSEQMSIAKFIGRNRGYGVAYAKDFFEKGISDCLSSVIKFRYDDVLNITRNYIKANTVRHANV